VLGKDTGTSQGGGGCKKWLTVCGVAKKKKKNSCNTGVALVKGKKEKVDLEGGCQVEKP